MSPGPNAAPPVAYFTMEVALVDELPTFSGGLGVLAGDVLRSAADLGEPVVGISICWRDGYFRQLIDATGHQQAEPVRWERDAVLERLEPQVEIEVAGRSVTIGCWVKVLVGASGSEVPVYFLDTDLAQNSEEDRVISDQLYGGDPAHRLAQEAVLGFGGVAMLAALGITPAVFHMNEGHSSLLTLALLERETRPGASPMVSAVQPRCVFTTHTPVAAGHDVFPASLVGELLGSERAATLASIGQLEEGQLNMTELGMSLSHYVNGVSLRHQTVAQELAPTHRVESVTNGVHLATWTAPVFAELFDRHVPEWRVDNVLLRYVGSVPLHEIAEAHAKAKASLLDDMAERLGVRLDPSVLTIGLARRATPYKQTTLLFSDLDRLRAIAAKRGPIQVLCAGKAHPRDEAGQQLIATIVDAGGALAGDVEVHFVPDYGLEIAKLLCAGTDLWLNNPIKPLEASGTSGMKAAVNGVPSLSTLDGWWIEGWFEGLTGWAIGTLDDGDDEAALYDALEERVLPCYYGASDGYTEVMRNSIALNAAFFNTERVVREYARDAYRPRAQGSRA